MGDRVITRCAPADASGDRVIRENDHELPITPSPITPSYSISRAVRRATSSPCSRRTTCSAMSMPAETPAEVMISPWSTTRASARTSVAG